MNTEPVVLSRRVVPARAGAATRVLMMVDDPDAGVTDIATAIGSDPAFAARVLALANSAYYGLSARVGTLHYATAVLGFQTIRAVAVSIAAGLDQPGAVPDGFWEQASISATAATLVAPMVGAKAPDAFCVGLLHTLGAALLHTQHPLPQLCLPMLADSDSLDRTEQELYQIGHAEAGAQLLAEWRFPPRFCALVASHHDLPLPDADPLTRALHAARALTHLVLTERADAGAAESTLQRLSEGRLTHTTITPLLGRIGEESTALLEGLQAR